MEKLQITLVKTDEINKNSNAVIDKGCQELEEAIKKLEPEGKQITNSTLKLAILNLKNSKLRRRGKLSAYEIHSSRDQVTGDNMKLDDTQLRENQLKTRETKQASSLTPEVHVGDTVVTRSRDDKHSAKDMYIVTNKSKENVEIQKILHPLYGWL